MSRSQKPVRSRESRPVSTARRRLQPSEVVALVIGLAFGISALLVASGLFIRLAFSH